MKQSDTEEKVFISFSFILYFVNLQTRHNVQTARTVRALDSLWPRPQWKWVTGIWVREARQRLLTAARDWPWPHTRVRKTFFYFSKISNNHFLHIKENTFWWCKQNNTIEKCKTVFSSLCPWPGWVAATFLRLKKLKVSRRVLTGNQVTWPGQGPGKHQRMTCHWISSWWNSFEVNSVRILHVTISSYNL